MTGVMMMTGKNVKKNKILTSPRYYGVFYFINI